MIVTSDAEFERAIYHIDVQGLLAVDLETTGLYPFNGDTIIGIAVASPQRAYYFPFGHKDGPNLDETYLRELTPMLSMPQTLYVGHNYKFDLKFLHEAGVPLPKRIADTMIGAKLHNENESAALKTWADKYIAEGSSAEQDEVKDALKELGYKGKKAFGHLAKLSPELVGKYAIQDVRLTLQVFDKLRDRLARYGLLKLWIEYNEYLLALTRMELRGVTVDLGRCDELSESFDINARIELDALRKMFNVPALNPRSPKQICELLGIQSSAKAVLEKMQAEPSARGSFASALLKYRKLAKARGTYFEPYKTWADKNNVIHPTFNIGGTRTGRLSCSDPNLQQVPRDAATVKSVFVARPGKVFIEADYAQAELRFAAHLADDKRMIEVFNKGLDPHFLTALEVNSDAAVRTAEMLLMQCGLPANRAGAEVLCRLQECSEPETVVRICREFGADQESRRGFGRGTNDRSITSYLENGYGGIPELSEEFVRTLQQYETLVRASSGPGQVEQPRIEPRNAVSILSRAGTSVSTELTSEWAGYRQKAKTTNFGVIYSIGANGLAQQLKVPVGTARNYLNGFNETYPEFKRASKQAERDARNDGFVQLWTGRIRRLDQDNARLAFNSLIQGGAAEIMRRAITRIDREHDGPSGLHMLITVHDSILFEVPEDRADEYTRYIRLAMLADNDKFSVAQDVDLKVGTVWGNLGKVDILADKGAIA